MRVALACLIFIAALLVGAPARAQAPAVDQYGGGGGNSGSQAGGGAPGGSGPSGGPPGSSGGQPGSGSSGAPGGTGSPGGGSSGGGSSGEPNGPPPTLRIAFGATSERLGNEIDAALLQGGIVPSMAAGVSRADIERFLDSALARRLSSGDAADVGRAVAELVVDPGPQTPAVLRALLGYAPSIGDATHAVFTRNEQATGDIAAFVDGFVGGSDAVPRAYVEMSNATPSFVTAFDELGVPTVDNIETAAGKAALVAILVSGAEGNFGSGPTADSKVVDGEIKPLSAVVDDAGGGGGVRLSYLLLGLVVLAMLWSALGLRPRPRRPG